MTPTYEQDIQDWGAKQGICVETLPWVPADAYFDVMGGLMAGLAAAAKSDTLFANYVARVDFIETSPPRSRWDRTLDVIADSPVLLFLVTMVISVAAGVGAAAIVQYLIYGHL